MSGPRWWAPDGPWPQRTLDDLLPDDDAALVASVAGGLAAAGVGRGDRVSWQLPNGPEAIALYRACWRIGAVAAPIHHRAGPADAASLRRRIGPAAFVAGVDDLPDGPPVERGTAAVAPTDVAVALATGGSTGTPKLAFHTHRALAHKATVQASVHRLGPGDCTLLAAPLAHVSGLLNGVLVRAAGVRVVPMAAWDPDEAVDLVRRERVTYMVGPPTFFVSMLGAAGFTPEAVRSLRQVSCGGAGVTPAFVRGASAALGARVKRTYGSTEAPTVTTSTVDDDPDRAAETDGRPVPGVEVRVDDGGELLVRGPELFVGYDDPAATAATLDGDGWFRTGDLATLDDGWVTIVGRRKDVIIRSGENVVPGEIEALLEAHPGVRQAAVVGVPDDVVGERVCAVVVPAHGVGAGFDLAECRRWCEANGVTRFKWPERVESLAALPLLPAGKPDKAALRALLAPD